MWGTIPQLGGLTTTVLDLTNDLSPLLVGLIGLTWLSAAIIAGIAVRHHWLQKTTSTGETVSTPADHRDAA
jgi:hypothetical protein